jgi:hypothetical protein
MSYNVKLSVEKNYARAVRFANQGSLDKACPIFRKVAELNPCADAFSNLGVALATMGEFDEGRYFLEQSLDLAEGQESVMQYLEWVNSEISKRDAVVKLAQEIDTLDEEVAHSPTNKSKDGPSPLEVAEKAEDDVRSPPKADQVEDDVGGGPEVSLPRVRSGLVVAEVRAAGAKLPPLSKSASAPVGKVKVRKGSDPIPAMVPAVPKLERGREKVVAVRVKKPFVKKTPAEMADEKAAEIAARKETIKANRAKAAAALQQVGEEQQLVAWPPANMPAASNEAETAARAMLENSKVPLDYLAVRKQWQARAGRPLLQEEKDAISTMLGVDKVVSVAKKGEGGGKAGLPSGIAVKREAAVSTKYPRHKSVVMSMTKHVPDGLRVRKGPGTDTEHIATLIWDHGASLLVAEQRGDWVKLCPSMYEDRLRQSPDFKPHSPDADGWCLRRHKKMTFIAMDAAEQRKQRIAQKAAGSI